MAVSVYTCFFVCVYLNTCLCECVHMPLCVCLHAQNESDVLKWVVRKEFGEMRRCLELEEAAFMQRVESTASALIGSIQSQADHMGTLLARFQEAEGTLDALSNESHLTFITVRREGRPVPQIYLY